MNEVEIENSKLPFVWSPLTEEMKPWIDTSKLYCAPAPCKKENKEDDCIIA
jgi:hypothetical protein